jgi:hypothetical protein
MKIAEEVKISENGFVFNSKTGDSFSLNPLGLELINMLAGDKGIEEIMGEFTEKYDVDELTFEKDFYEFCSLLKYYKIISQDDQPEFA